MKKHTFAISLALVAAAMLAPKVSAQDYQRRDVAEIANAGRDYDRDRGGDWDRRVRDDLARLDGQLSELRRDIGGMRDPSVRERFHRLRERADRLNAAFDQHRIRGWEAQRRADEIRHESDALRREVRERYRH